jgi:hypothetical protein
LALVGRALVAVGFTGLVALFVRLRGTGGTPSHRGGWRQLSVQDLAAPPPEGRAAEPTGA